MRGTWDRLRWAGSRAAQREYEEAIAKASRRRAERLQSSKPPKKKRRRPRQPRVRPSTPQKIDYHLDREFRSIVAPTPKHHP